jgi:hypothetical protein
MFIFVVQTLHKKWNEIRMKQQAGGKHMGNNWFLRTLKFEMKVYKFWLKWNPNHPGVEFLKSLVSTSRAGLIEYYKKMGLDFEHRKKFKISITFNKIEPRNDLFFLPMFYIVLLHFFFKLLLIFLIFYNFL